MTFTGQTALITGASTGIGAVYARELAARGANLILVARSEDKMQTIATQLRTAHHRRVDVLAADLVQHGAADNLAQRVSALGLTVDVLVNNAGFATHGDVATTDPARLTAQVQLNCLAMVDLTSRFLPAMITRGDGTIVNVASTAAFQPVPHMAVYAATKAFVLSFTEALWAETKPTGVRVIAICPGATETPFFDVVGAEEASVGKRRTPEQVVATTFKALKQGLPSVVDGRFNAFVAHLPGVLPRRTTIGIAERSVRPRTSHQAADAATH
ncbi:SDR family NAD(P)-dependent oxidoreductase [Candidatus Protofrankia californiensis]|uniref:SDR family NAD(P)-dependent oxidoreductase n=1 Tax=Candidatus Protofrankia californiensis TaxID=1839754 RepID=UPI001041317E|nr:SDR family oxidoreductase [Candidatus Protofrankia californiensis]